MDEVDDTKKLKPLSETRSETRAPGDETVSSSVVDLPYAYEQETHKKTRSSALEDVSGDGIEMTSYRRPSAVTPADRDRFRRYSQLGAGRPEVESQQTVSGRNSVVEEEPTGADAIDRGAIDGGFGWVIVACESKAVAKTSRDELTLNHPAGTFTIAFHFLGFLFSWGVIQSALLEQGLASTRLLSVIGGLATFWNAAGCFPVRPQPISPILPTFH